MQVEVRLCAVLALSLAALLPNQALAKGTTDKLTVEGPELAAPVEITDSAYLSGFDPWSRRFIAWDRGLVAAPPLDQTYTVSFYLQDTKIYVLEYAPDPSGGSGYIYVPGPGHPFYQLNIGTIITGDSDRWDPNGKWHYATTAWDAVIQRALEPLEVTCPVTESRPTRPYPWAPVGIGTGTWISPGTWHGNDRLWVGLPGSRVIKALDPETGVIEEKFLWRVEIPGELRITGRRLDAPAPPLSSHVLEGYNRPGFQVSALIFPTAGCWGVTGSVAGKEITFIVEVLCNYRPDACAPQSIPNIESAPKPARTPLPKATMPQLWAGAAVAIGLIGTLAWMIWRLRQPRTGRLVAAPLWRAAAQKGMAALPGVAARWTLLGGLHR